MPTYTRKEGDMVVTYSEEEYVAVKKKEEMPDWQLILLILVTFPVSVPLMIIAGIAGGILYYGGKLFGFFEDD